MGDLANVFQNLGTASSHAGNVSTNANTMNNALKALQQNTPSLVSNLGLVVNAFNGLGGAKIIGQVGSSMSAVNGMFSAFSSSAQSSASVTPKAIGQITKAMSLLQLDAPLLSTALGQIVDSFQGLLATNTVKDQLGNLGTVFQKLNGLFGQFGSTAKNSGGVTAGGLLQITAALSLLNKSGNYISTTVLDMETKFKKLGNMHELFGTLNNLMVLFTKLGQVFTGVAKAAVDANAMSNAPLTTMQTQIGKLGTTLQTLGTTVQQASGPIVSNLQGLVNNMVNLLTGKATINSFVNAGAAMMLGLASGIQKTSSVVSGAVTTAAGNIHLAHGKAIKSNSPSLLYAEDGKNMMLGLVQGIKGNQGLVASAIKNTVTPVGPVGVGGLAARNHTMTVNATFHINAPNGDSQQIRKAIEVDSAAQFARATLTALRAGAGTVY